MKSNVLPFGECDLDLAVVSSGTLPSPSIRGLRSHQPKVELHLQEVMPSLLFLSEIVLNNLMQFYYF